MRSKLPTGGTGGRYAAVACIMVGSLLLPAVILFASKEQSLGARALDRKLEVAADNEKAALEALLDRARQTVLLMANNPAFRGFYEEPGTTADKMVHRTKSLRQVEDALVFLHTLYPDAIGESCFIDVSGVEIARAVGPVKAKTSELSPDESGNPFFAPTFRLKPGQVFQSKPYVSPDTGEWVIATATPVLVADGSTKAIVHFELSVESFRSRLLDLDADSKFKVIDARSGSVLVDGSSAQRKGAPLGRPGRHLPKFIASSGFADLRTERVAYRHVASTIGNANDWYVVASDRRAPEFPRGTQPVDFLLIAVAIGSIVLGVAKYRAASRQDRARLDEAEREISSVKETERALRKALEMEQAAAESLRAVDAMKTGLIHAVSHELRTPLTAIRGLTNLLTSDAPESMLSDDDRTQCLQRIDGNARKLERLLGDLLDMDRIDRGAFEPDRRPTDLGELVRRVVSELGPQAAERVTVHADAVVSAVDKPKTERIVENLVLNALKHSDSSGEIRVNVRAMAGGALIEVEDSGKGVPDELKTRIFEPFVQGPADVTRPRGSGIGLSLVAKFAALHGGRAWVEDRREGGASFKVLLPKAA